MDTLLAQSINSNPISPKVLSSLCAIDIELFWLLLDLSNRQSKKTKSKAAYCYCGQAWLATRLNVCRNTINNAMRRLHNLKLIHKQHRRRHNGRWQTCLYKLGAAAYAKIYSNIKRLKNLHYRAQQFGHIVTNISINSKTNAQGVPRGDIQGHINTMNTILNDP